MARQHAAQQCDGYDIGGNGNKFQYGIDGENKMWKRCTYFNIKLGNGRALMETVNGQ